MNSKIFPLWIAVALGCTASAKATEATCETTNSTLAYRPFSVSAEAGSTGIGGAVRWRFSDHLGLRTGMDYLKYSYNGNIEGINYNVKLKLQSEPLTLDIYPWKNHSFYISLGAGFNQNQLTGVSSGATVEIGDTEYSTDGGRVNLKIDQLPVSPYLSIGGNLFYFDKAHRWSLAGELGVMYTGNPNANITTAGNFTGPGGAVLADAIAKEEQQIEDALRGFPFYPVVKLAVSFSF